MAERGEKINAPKTSLNLSVPESWKVEFHVWCIRHKREMTEVILGAVQQVITGKVPAPPKIERPNKGRRKA